MTESKILDLDSLTQVRKALAEQGRTVVQCHGCFDIVHPGHLRYLQFAKSQGDVLVVSVSSDAVVGKGAERPYIPEQLRLENLAALQCVDHVILDDQLWAGPILEALKPDIYIKGKEYEKKQDTRFAREKQLVEDYGGRVVFASGDVVFSSTAIVRRFSDRFGLEQEKVQAYCDRHGVDRGSVDALISQFSGKKMLVVGDALLDRYVHCDQASVASEGTILSVSPVREEWFVGAGALIAAQFAALGADATLLTTQLDAGPHADRFRELLAAHDVGLAMVPGEARPVYVKTRYLVDDRKLLKLNEGPHTPLSTVGTRAMSQALEERLPQADGLVVADFGYGLFTQTLTEAVVRLSQQTGVPYFADVTRSARANILRFKKPAVATPTEQELRDALVDTEAGLSNLAWRYYEETQAQNLILTLGSRGSLLFYPAVPGERRLRTEYLPALSVPDRDRVGCGDVFLSFVALAQVCAAPLPLAMYVAGAMAACHVSSLGNAPIDRVTVEDWLSHRPELG